MRSVKRFGLLVLVMLAVACRSVTGPQDREPKDDTDGGGKTGEFAAVAAVGTWA